MSSVESQQWQLDSLAQISNRLTQRIMELEKTVFKHSSQLSQLNDAMDSKAKQQQPSSTKQQSDDSSKSLNEDKQNTSLAPSEPQPALLLQSTQRKSSIQSNNKAMPINGRFCSILDIDDTMPSVVVTKHLTATQFDKMAIIGVLCDRPFTYFMWKDVKTGGYFAFRCVASTLVSTPMIRQVLSSTTVIKCCEHVEQTVQNLQDECFELSTDKPSLTLNNFFNITPFQKKEKAVIGTSPTGFVKLGDILEFGRKLISQFLSMNSSSETTTPTNQDSFAPSTSTNAAIQSTPSASSSDQKHTLSPTNPSFNFDHDKSTNCGTCTLPPLTSDEKKIMDFYNSDSTPPLSIRKSGLIKNLLNSTVLSKQRSQKEKKQLRDTVNSLMKKGYLTQIIDDDDDQ
jgi:hypothetical protein